MFKANLLTVQVMQAYDAQTSCSHLHMRLINLQFFSSELLMQTTQPVNGK